jgi:GTP diphosphokinase / guanosine-3',5'-bis(diphosphate) 3'-diphosphatase
VTHPLAVAGILADMHMDHQSLMAAMLHDVIEDTGYCQRRTRTPSSATVAELVDGVSKLTQMNFETKAEAQAENFQKMAMAMARDIRVILVKLADRLHNMRTLEVLSGKTPTHRQGNPGNLRADCQPLGMHSMRIEFEDLGFKAMYPMRADPHPRRGQKARAAIARKWSTRSKIDQHCLAREGLEGRSVGREKHLYSIYQKMRSKKSFNEIMDVYAFRIVVDKVDTCYRVLGAVHNLYKPVPGRFKDYIAIPKANGYQSLHTTLFGMHGVPIEIQIRTREMEEMANNGIAAHWLYKSNEGPAAAATPARRSGSQGLLEMQQRAGNSLEFIENVKIDLFPDEVYVFTPKGASWSCRKALRRSTFAYAVHTDVGNTCIACRINRRLAPLSASRWKAAQTVEIVTHPARDPTRCG